MRACTVGTYGEWESPCAKYDSVRQETERKLSSLIWKSQLRKGGLYCEVNKEKAPNTIVALLLDRRSFLRYNRNVKYVTEMSTGEMKHKQSGRAQ